MQGGWGVNGGEGPLIHQEGERILRTAYGPLRVAKAAKH